MRKRKKQKIGNLLRALLFCALFCIFTAPAAAYATSSEASVSLSKPPKQQGLSLSLQYGYQNTAKSGKYLPVTAVIGNYTEADFSGTLDISAEENGDMLHYRYAAAAKAGSEARVSATISVTDSVHALVLRLYDEAGELLAESEEKLSVQGSEDELLIGVLSDTPQELSYFRGLSLANTTLRTRTVNLDAASLPETEEGLAQLDLIVISNFDMNTLPQEDLQTLWAWTEDGGALLLGLGDTENPVGGLSGFLEELEIGEAEERSVDMGIQYSTDSPDGARLTLPVRSVYSPEGIQAMQSDGLAVLTNISAGSGVLGLAAYDLCDIREFCSRELGYPDELLKALLGNARIKRLTAASAEKLRGYETLSALVNMPDALRYPNMTVYLVIALIYVLLAGPGVYFLLRKNGLAICYFPAVILLSLSAAVVLWFAGLKTRYELPLIEYASVREQSGEKSSRTAFLNVSVPFKERLRLSVSPDYLVQPVLSGEAELVKRELVIGSSAEEQYIEAEGLEPFETRLFELYRTENGGSEAPLISADLQYFDDRLSGSVTNRSEENLEDAALLLHGRIILIGDLAAGQTKDLTGYETVYGPIGFGKLTAAYITDFASYSRQQAQYQYALSHMRLLAWYLEDTLSNYYSGARFVAFQREDAPSAPAVLTEQASSYGTGLYAQLIDIDIREGDEICRSALAQEPKLISGDYEAGSNTTSSTASVVLEYALGSDLSVTSLKFNGLSDAFNGRLADGEQRLTVFRGTRALYNYRTGAYDTLGASENRLPAERLAPYLSPANTINVRYIPDESADSAAIMFLPVPMVTGVEK